MSKDKVKTETIQLFSPPHKTVLALDAMRFTWAPFAKADTLPDLKYRLVFYEDDPKTAFGQAPVGNIVFKTELSKATSRVLSVDEARRLTEFEQLYWRVEAEDIVNDRLYWSPTRRVAGRLPFRSRVGAFTSPTVEIDGGFLEPFKTCPPRVWGCPVLMRFESDTLPEEDDGGADPGTVEPPPAIWGTEAAELFLIDVLWKRCEISWDHSDDPDCDRVLLQVSDGGGFRNPETLDAAADEGVHLWWTGDPLIDSELSILWIAGDSEREVPVHQINLQGADSRLWPAVQVRTAILDADGNQVGPATDHVTVHCVPPPAIEIVTESVEYRWGENLARQFDITIRCMGSICSVDDPFPFPGPATLCIATVPDFSSPGIHGDFSINTRCIYNDEELPVRRVRIPADIVQSDPCMPYSWEKWAYVVDIPEWEPGSIHHFVLEQDFNPNWARYALWCFLRPRLRVYCAPGLRPSWPYFTSPLPQIDYTFDSILNSLVTISDFCDYSGLQALFDYFSRPFVGHRVSSADGEQDVQIEFEFDDMSDVEGFADSIGLSTAPVNCVHETIDGTTETFKLVLEGLKFSFYTYNEDGFSYETHRPPDGPNVVLGVEEGSLEIHFKYRGLGDTLGDVDLDYFLTHA
jgi:hypothetical protein